MPKNETGEFELVLGNKQLLSGFAVVVILLGVFLAMGYVIGRNSVQSTRAASPDTQAAVATPADPGRAQNAPPPAAAPEPAPPAQPAPTADTTPAPTTQAARPPEAAKQAEKPAETAAPSVQTADSLQPGTYALRTTDRANRLQLAVANPVVDRAT